MGHILSVLVLLMVEIIRKKEKLNWKELSFLLLVFYDGFAFGTFLFSKAFGVLR